MRNLNLSYRQAFSRGHLLFQVRQSLATIINDTQTFTFFVEKTIILFMNPFFKIIFTLVEDTSKTSFTAAVRECNTSPLLVIQSVLKLIKACMLWCFIKGNVKEYIKLCHTNQQYACICLQYMSLTGGKQYSGELFHFEKKIVPYLLSRSTLAMSCEGVIITLHSTRAFSDPRNPPNR